MSGSSQNDFGYQGIKWGPMGAGDGSYSTFQIPQGYKATPKPDGNFQYDYDYDEQKLSDPNRDIETIRMQIKGQRPGSISALADYWEKVGQLLDTVKQTVAQQADALHGGSSGGFGGWQSPAADEFLRWGPGASLYSIEQWSKAAYSNVAGLRQLAQDVHDAHAEIDEAWESYLTEAKSDKAKLLAQWGGPDPSQFPVSEQKKLPGPAADFMSQMYEHQTAIWRKWSVAAQRIAYKLSQKYYTQLEGPLAEGRGTRFEGPANAVIDQPSLMRLVAPGGVPGGPPGGPGAAPPPPGGLGAAPPPPPPPPPPAANLAKPPALKLAPPPLPSSPLPSSPPPPPPAPAPPPARLSLGPSGSLQISPDLADLLGLVPPPVKLTTTALASLRATGTLTARSLGLAGELPSVDRATLTRSGVLRPSMPGGDAEPPVSPAMRSPGATRPPRMGAGGEEPEMPPSRRAGVVGRETSERMGPPPGGEEEPFGSPGARVPGTTSPVLGARRPPTGARLRPMEKEASLRGGPTRPGTAPAVLKAGDRSRRPGDPTVDDVRTCTAGTPGATAPVLGNRLRDQTPVESFGEVPHALRGHDGGQAQPAPSELGSRRRTQADHSIPVAPLGAPPDEGPRVIGDEQAWVVETPGGPILDNNRPKRSTPRAEPRPVLGGES